MRGDARKRLFATAPPEVLLARLSIELETSLMALNAGRIDTAVQAMERALDLVAQIKEA